MTAITATMAEAAPYVAAAGAVAGYVQTQQTAAKQEEAVREGYAQQTNQLQLQQVQNNQQAADKMSAVALESLRETGRLRTIAGDVGANGVSADRAENEVQMNAGTDIATIEANRMNSSMQTSADGVAMRLQATERLNSIKQPSLIGTGLQIAGAFVDEQTRQQRNRVPEAKTYGGYRYTDVYKPDSLRGGA